MFHEHPEIRGQQFICAVKRHQWVVRIDIDSKGKELSHVCMRCYDVTTQFPPPWN